MGGNIFWRSMQMNFEDDAFSWIEDSTTLEEQDERD
jgi:hypothetical protein